MTDATPTTAELLSLTTQIVSAHVGNNAVAPSDVPALIAAVHEALSQTSGAAPTEPPAPVPAVPIRKSIQPDYLVCLEDGRQVKMLKRHLMTAYGMTPDDYRAKWGLSHDYPMVAPSYAERRSELAKSIGLGRQGRTGAPAKTPAKRGRKAKAEA